LLPKPNAVITSHSSCVESVCVILTMPMLLDFSRISIGVSVPWRFTSWITRPRVAHDPFSHQMG
jgi:hypothetical protein